MSLINSYIDFSSNYMYFILIILFVLLLVIIIILFLVKKNKTKKNNFKFTENQIYEYIGGKDNLISKHLNGTRLTLELKNNSLVQRDKLLKIGAERVLVMSNKYILVGKNVNLIYKKLDNI